MQARKQAFTNDSWPFPNKPKQPSFDNTYSSVKNIKRIAKPRKQETIATLFGEL